MTEEPAGRTEFVTEIRVRYAETDGQGFLHHSRYLVYFEVARTEALRELGLPYRVIEERGLFLILAKFEVNYRRPARYDDLLKITTRVLRQSGARLEHGYEVHCGSELLTTATSVLACVDANGNVKRMPDFDELARNYRGSEGV